MTRREEVSVFSVVNQADSTVHRDLEEWSRVAAKLVNQAVENDSPLQSRIEANARLISLIQEDAVSTPENFRGVRDSSENLQAGAIVSNMGDRLYVDFIATAPWNITGEEPKSVRRAATMLMAHIVRESIDKGYEGRIIVDAVASSADFYRRMGFIETEESLASVPEIILTPEAALDFLSDITGE